MATTQSINQVAYVYPSHCQDFLSTVGNIETMRGMIGTLLLDLFSHFSDLVQVICIDPIDNISSSRTSIQQFLYTYLLPMTS